MPPAPSGAPAQKPRVRASSPFHSTRAELAVCPPKNWRTFASLIQLSKNLRPAPGGASRSYREEIKNPASSAGPSRPWRDRAMLDVFLSCIRNQPHFGSARANPQTCPPQESSNQPRKYSSSCRVVKPLLSPFFHPSLCKSFGLVEIEPGDEGHPGSAAVFTISRGKSRRTCTRCSLTLDRVLPRRCALRYRPAGDFH